MTPLKSWFCAKTKKYRCTQPPFSDPFLRFLTVKRHACQKLFKVGWEHPHLRPDSWSTIKITPRKEFWSTNYPVLILTIFAILSFSKNPNDKIWKKMSFFMSNLKPEGQKLPACKFWAWSEVRIVEMTFWRFGWFFGYFPKIIQFLRSDSKSTIKITPRKKIWSI